MNMKSFVSFIIVVSVFMMGCATAPSPRQSQRTSAVIDAPKDKVWPLLVEEVGSKYAIQAIDKESGSITTQVVRMPVVHRNTKSFRNYVFIGGPGASYQYERLRMNMRITATEFEQEKTTITINAHYEAYVTHRDQGRAWMIFPSNGSVENQILTNIEDKLE